MNTLLISEEICPTADKNQIVNWDGYALQMMT